MNYKHLLYASAAFCAMLFASSCTDDETGKPGEQTLDFTLTVNMPISVESPELTSVEATFTEVTTGQTTTVTEFSTAQEESYRIDADLLPGQYNLTLKGCDPLHAGRGNRRGRHRGFAHEHPRLGGVARTDRRDDRSHDPHQQLRHRGDLLHGQPHPPRGSNTTATST